MTPLEAARGHLAKAHEFLAEAKFALSNGHANVATSNAIIAGINAKDAICLGPGRQDRQSRRPPAGRWRTAEGRQDRSGSGFHA